MAEPESSTEFLQHGASMLENVTELGGYWDMLRRDIANVIRDPVVPNTKVMLLGDASSAPGLLEVVRELFEDKGSPRTRQEGWLMVKPEENSFASVRGAAARSRSPITDGGDRRMLAPHCPLADDHWWGQRAGL